MNKTLYNLRLLLITIFFISIFGCEQYERISKTERFNKRTGETEILTSDGYWIKLSALKKRNTKAEEKRKLEQEKYYQEKEEIERIENEKKYQNIPYDIRKKIRGKATYSLGGTFKVDVNNLSDWHINRIVVEVRIYSNDDSTKLGVREFRFRDFYFPIKPLSKKSLSSMTKVKLPNNVYWQYSFKILKGYKE